MTTTRLLISIIALLIAIPISRSKGRRSLLWAPLSAAYPAFPGFLLQTNPEEKIGKELAIRSLLSGALALIAVYFISGGALTFALEGYESFIQSNVSSVLTILDLTHFREGSVFEFPNIMIELPSGGSYLYTAFLFAVVSASIALFFRTTNPVWILAYASVFAIIGHAFAVAIVVSTFSAMQNPEEITQNFFTKYRDLYWVLGTLLIYSSFYFITWLTSKKRNQNQSSHSMRVVAPESRSDPASAPR